MSRVNGALYSFGYGLSYTTFEYSDIEISPKVITPNQKATVRCKVTNTGKRAGDEVVQLYVRDILSSVTTYEKNLAGFERIHLQPGETKEVVFTLDRKQPEGTVSFTKYIRNTVTKRRINEGRMLLEDNRKLLTKIAKTYQVEPYEVWRRLKLRTDNHGVAPCCASLRCAGRAASSSTSVR